MDFFPSVVFFDLAGAQHGSTDGGGDFKGCVCCTLNQIESKTFDPVGIENNINTKPHLHTVRTQWWRYWNIIHLTL